MAFLPAMVLEDADVGGEHGRCGGSGSQRETRSSSCGVSGVVACSRHSFLGSTQDEEAEAPKIEGSRCEHRARVSARARREALTLYSPFAHPSLIISHPRSGSSINKRCRLEERKVNSAVGTDVWFKE